MHTYTFHAANDADKTYTVTAEDLYAAWCELVLAISQGETATTPSAVTACQKHWRLAEVRQ